MSVTLFGVLGPFEVNCDQGRLPIRGSKQPAVLSALVLSRGHSLGMHHLVDLVWGDAPVATAAKQVRNCVSDLRQVLAPTGCRIILENDYYRLELGSAHLDLAEFRHNVAHARHLAVTAPLDNAVRQLQLALSLWRGPALAGIGNRAMEAQARALDEERLLAVELMVELELTQGDGRHLIGDLFGWVAEHPLRERLVGQLMLALWRSGAQARAFALYDDTCRRLDAVLGVNPGPELRELHRRLVVADPRLGDPSQCQPRPLLPRGITRTPGTGPVGRRAGAHSRSQHCERTHNLPQRRDGDAAAC